VAALTKNQVKHMNDHPRDLEQCDEDIILCEFSDEALEAAAETTASVAMSIVGAPTVSILFACCG
jgi:hypothetical protein